MFGKIFASMFTGSLYGKGAIKFALMGYVIANMKPNRAEKRMEVELNSKVLADIFGEDLKDVDEAISFLCAPDKESRTEEHDGRRLLPIGQFDYVVVNGMRYRMLRDEEQRKMQNAAAQQRFRNKRGAGGGRRGARGARRQRPAGVDGRERRYERAMERGDTDEMARLTGTADGPPVPGVVEEGANGEAA